MGKKKDQQNLLLKGKASLGKGEQLTPLIFWLIWPSRKHEDFLRKSPTHSGSLNPQKAQQPLPEQASCQDRWFPQEK